MTGQCTIVVSMLISSLSHFLKEVEMVRENTCDGVSTSVLYSKLLACLFDNGCDPSVVGL